MTARAALTHARLKSLLAYDPDEGFFRCRVGRTRLHAGDITGTRTPDGWQIGIDGRQYRAGRLAFFYMRGHWPEGVIDHIDRDPFNDRWANLRPASPAEDQANKGIPRNSVTGVKGVWFDARRRSWAGQVISRGKVFKRHFSMIDDAARYVRETREKLHGGFACHG
jgi:hypothetical protein